MFTYSSSASVGSFALTSFVTTVNISSTVKNNETTSRAATVTYSAAPTTYTLHRANITQTDTSYQNATSTIKHPLADFESWETFALIAGIIVCSALIMGVVTLIIPRKRNHSNGPGQTEADDIEYQSGESVYINNMHAADVSLGLQNPVFQSDSEDDTGPKKILNANNVYSKVEKGIKKLQPAPDNRFSEDYDVIPDRDIALATIREYNNVKRDNNSHLKLKDNQVITQDTIKNRPNTLNLDKTSTASSDDYAVPRSYLLPDTYAISPVKIEPPKFPQNNNDNRVVYFKFEKVSPEEEDTGQDYYNAPLPYMDEDYYNIPRINYNSTFHSQVLPPDVSGADSSQDGDHLASSCYGYQEKCSPVLPHVYMNLPPLKPPRVNDFTPHSTPTHSPIMKKNGKRMGPQIFDDGPGNYANVHLESVKKLNTESMNAHLQAYGEVADLLDGIPEDLFSD